MDVIWDCTPQRTGSQKQLFDYHNGVLASS